MIRSDTTRDAVLHGAAAGPAFVPRMGSRGLYYTEHKIVCYTNGDKSKVDVDVAGRQGTINRVMEATAGPTYYRITVDIRDHEITYVSVVGHR